MSLLLGLVIAFLAMLVVVAIVYLPFMWLLDGFRHLEDRLGATWATRHTATCPGCKRCLLELTA